MEKRFDFERTCMNEEQANYVINAVINEYSQSPDWIIGKASKETLPSGEVKVVVELTKVYEEERSSSQRR